MRTYSELLNLHLFDRPGKILNISILTLDRKATMIQLTSVKLATRYVCFIYKFLLLLMQWFLTFLWLKVQKFCQPSKVF